MEIRKNDEFELTIEDMSEDGAGIGKQDGYIWFVKDAVIGDRIRARAMKMKKNYGFARLVKLAVVLLCRRRNGKMVRRIRLDHHVSRELPPSGPAGCLGQKLKGPLRAPSFR